MFRPPLTPLGAPPFQIDSCILLILTLGAEGGPDPDKREQKDSDNADTSRFNKPADVSVDPVSGTVFVADGYGNSRVVAFDPSGGCATARRNGRVTVT